MIGVIEVLMGDRNAFSGVGSWSCDDRGLCRAATASAAARQRVKFGSEMKKNGAIFASAPS